MNVVFGNLRQIYSDKGSSKSVYLSLLYFRMLSDEAVQIQAHAMADQGNLTEQINLRNGDHGDATKLFVGQIPKDVSY